MPAARSGSESRTSQGPPGLLVSLWACAQDLPTAPPRVIEGSNFHLLVCHVTGLSNFTASWPRNAQISSGA